MTTKKFIAKFGLDNNNNTISNVADPVNPTDAATKRVTDAISALANTASANTYNLQTNLIAANTFLKANDALTLSSARSYTDTANSYITSNLNTANNFLRANDALTLATAKSYTDTANSYLQNLIIGDGFATVTQLNQANTFLQANDALTLSTAKSYTDVANTFLRANDSLTLSSAKSYTDNQLTANVITLNSVNNSQNTRLSLLESNTANLQTNLIAANTFLQANDALTLSSAKSYTDTSNSALKVYSDNKFLPFTGGTLTGPLIISNGGVTSLTTSGPVSITGDLSVQGNINLSGNSTTYNSNVAVIQDPMIYLASNNAADVVDIGFYGHFIGPGNSPYSHYQHTGLVRDYSDRKWKLFSNVAEPQVANSWVDFSNAIYDTLKVGNIETSSANINGNDLITYIDTVNNTQNNRLIVLESNTANLFVGLAGANTFLQANDALTLSSAKTYSDAQLSANVLVINSVDNTQNNRLSLLESNTSNLQTNLISANTFLRANDALTLSSAKSYTDAANTFLQANDALTLSNAKSYTDAQLTANVLIINSVDNAQNNRLSLLESNTANLQINLVSANTFLQANDALTLSSAKSYTDAQLSANVLIINSVDNTQNTNITTAQNTANVGNTFVSYGGNVGGSINASGNIISTSGQIYQNNISMLAMSLIFGG